MAKNRRAKNINYQNFLTKTTDYIYSNKLQIAEFQRNYNWTANFVIDLIRSIDNNNTHYYLGNIVTQESSTGGTAGWDLVIDGQQRLVTLSLILNAVKNIIEEEKYIKKIDNILFYNGNKNVPRIKFYRNNLDKTYRYILNGKDVSDADDENAKKIILNFKKITKEVINVKNITEFLDKIFLLDMVVIKCPDEHDMHQLFEALNSKNKKLSVVELIKNSFLRYSKGKHYKKVLKAWEETEKIFEKKNLFWFDKYMRHRWYFQGGYVTNNNLYKKINEHIKKLNEKNLLEYSVEIKNDADKYFKLRDISDLKKKEFSSKMDANAWRKSHLLMDFISRMGLDQIYSVLFALWKYGEKKPSYFERDDFFKDLEKIWAHLLLAVNSKISPSSYEKIYAKFCDDLKGVNYKDKKKKFFNELSKNKLIPPKKIFVDTFLSNIYNDGSINKKVSWKNDRDFIRSILLIYLSKGKHILPTDTTIEHIIPKSSLINWKNIGNKYLDVVKNESRYRLGNLTLLEKDDLGNLSFDDKYKKGYKDSNFLYNKSLKTDYGELFKSKDPTSAVNKRGRIIAGYIYEMLIETLKK